MKQFYKVNKDFSILSARLRETSWTNDLNILAIAKTIYFLIPIAIITACDNRQTHDPTTLVSDSVEIFINEGIMPDSVASYINAALDTMQKYSIRKDSIDWEELKTITFKKAQGSKTYSDTYSALSEALEVLGDNHSFFKTPEQYQQWLGTGEKVRVKIKFPKGKMLDDKIAYIKMYTFSSGDSMEMLSYANQLHKIIRGLDRKNPRGWIIDLWYNGGGNMWPMLAGVGPLLGEGNLGYFLTADGTSTPWSYEEGEVKVGNEVMMKVPSPYKMKNTNVPVAVFVGERTASSAEAILVSFIGRQKTKVFGEPTAGLSTGNKTISMVDGAQLILTSAVYTDRTKKKYGNSILPDVDYSDLWYFNLGFSYYTMKEDAKRWIKEVNEKSSGI